MSKKIWLSDASKKFWFSQNRPYAYVRTYVHPFMLADVKWHTFMQARNTIILCVQGIYSLCLTWYWTSMLWSIDSCQKRVSADQYHMTVSRTQLYNSWFSVFSFQLIAGTRPFFKGGIQFAFCLRQKLNYLRKTFLKTSLESFAFGLG